MSTDLIAIARVGRPHGVRGDMRVWPFAPASETLFEAKDVMVGAEGGQARRYEIHSCRKGPGGKNLLLSLKGLSSRDEAQALVGALVQVRPDQLAEIDEDEDAFYHKDLLGLPVEGPEGPLGVLEEIIDNGGHDVLVVRDREANLEVLLPFVEEMVEVAEGRLIASPPEGLLEATRTPIREIKPSSKRCTSKGRKKS